MRKHNQSPLGVWSNLSLLINSYEAIVHSTTEEAEERSHLLQVAPLVRSVSQMDWTQEIWIQSLEPQEWKDMNVTSTGHVGEPEHQEGPLSRGMSQNALRVVLSFVHN